MKVKITGHTSPMSICHMWYEERIGEVFEVEEDPEHEDLYQTIEPIYKEFKGSIYKTDCEIVVDESKAYGNDCNGRCEG